MMYICIHIYIYVYTYIIIYVYTYIIIYNMGFLKMEDPKNRGFSYQNALMTWMKKGGYLDGSFSTVRIANVHVNGPDWPVVVKYFQGLSCGFYFPFHIWDSPSH